MTWKCVKCGLPVVAEQDEIVEAYRKHAYDVHILPPPPPKP
jgi:hypothetical protein